MIKNPEVATQTSGTIMQLWDELCACRELVEKRCSSVEHAAFIKATGNIGVGIVMHVMEPLYEATPTLRSANWNDVPAGGGFCGLKS